MRPADKTPEDMRTNAADWRIGSLESLATTNDVNARRPGASHVVFEHPAVAEGCRFQHGGRSSRSMSAGSFG